MLNNFFYFRFCFETARKFLKMSQNILKFSFLLSFFTLSQAQRSFFEQNFTNFSLLSDLSCAVLQDELENHPEMRTIALIGCQNDFSLIFTGEILQCLPNWVKKEIWNEPERFNKIILSKETFTIISSNAGLKVRKKFELIFF